jgi:Fe-S cluster assembly iron-binding protein IscA
MVRLSDSALAELQAFFADRPKSGIRIYLAPGG